MAPIVCYDFEQRTSSWKIACLGTPGGSGISKLLTSKGERSAQADKYIKDLARERFTGKSASSDFVSEHMAHGTANEDASRALFELVTGMDVTIPGIVWKDEKQFCHYSPDGLMGDNAVLELKNPMAATHIKYLEKHVLPTQYRLQVQMGLYVTERDICYFMSNCDGYAPMIIKVGRDEELIKKIDACIINTEAEIRNAVKMMRDNDGMPF